MLAMAAEGLTPAEIQARSTAEAWERTVMQMLVTYTDLDLVTRYRLVTGKGLDTRTRKRIIDAIARAEAEALYQELLRSAVDQLAEVVE